MIGQYYGVLPVFYLRVLLWRTWLSCALVCLDDCHTHQLIARGRVGRTVTEECGMAAPCALLTLATGTAAKWRGKSRAGDGGRFTLVSQFLSRLMAHRRIHPPVRRAA